MPETIPIYHSDGLVTTHTTTITSAIPYRTLPEPSQQLFKQPPDDAQVAITASTIFHPQGGGQPSDIGQITTPDRSVIFTVSSVRHDAVEPAQILHLGEYAPSSTRRFNESETVEEAIDASKRHLFSRLHTAGHVLGLAARHYLESVGLTGLVDGKASHFPGMASVEFTGLIDGKHKAGIQAKVDEYVTRAFPVEIHEWDEKELSNPENSVYREGFSVDEKTGKLRVVSVVGCGAYPCGGTHVTDTAQCGRVIVYKISRAKGASRISYNLD